MQRLIRSELYPNWPLRKTLRNDLGRRIPNRNLYQGGAVVAVPDHGRLGVAWMVTDRADFPVLLEGIAEVVCQLAMARIDADL
jgi:hypothetical protein